MSSVDFGRHEFWNDIWESDGIPSWQKEDVHPMLVKHFDDFTGGGRKKLRIFVPFCGKTVDMLWLADQGHTVIGVEFSESAVEEFFTEHKLKYKLQTVYVSGKATNLYKAEEKDIGIFVCDIFDFSHEAADGQFDGIWERAGITSIDIHKNSRGNKYVELISSLLAPGGRYFLMTFRYTIERDYPPSSISENLFQELFGRKFDFRQVDVLHSHEKAFLPFVHDRLFHMLSHKGCHENEDHENEDHESEDHESEDHEDVKTKTRKRKHDPAQKDSTAKPQSGTPTV